MEIEKLEKLIDTSFNSVFTMLNNLNNKINQVNNKIIKIEEALNIEERSNEKEVVIKETVICYWHSKHGINAAKCSGRDCFYTKNEEIENEWTNESNVSESATPPEITNESNDEDLSAACESILKYMKMPRPISPINDPPQVMDNPVVNHIAYTGPTFEAVPAGKIREDKMNEIKDEARRLNDIIAIKTRRKSILLSSGSIN